VVERSVAGALLICVPQERSTAVLYLSSRDNGNGLLCDDITVGNICSQQFQYLVSRTCALANFLINWHKKSLGTTENQTKNIIRRI